MKTGFVKGVALLISSVALPLSVHAGLVINEIMYDLEGADAGREWVEVWNDGSDAVHVVGGSKEGSWRFFDGANHLLDDPSGAGWNIAAGELFIIADNRERFLSEHPGFKGLVIDSFFSLKNSGATLRIISGSGSVADEVIYTAGQGAAGNGKTLERGPDGAWSESVIIGGTPGAPNTSPQTAPQTLSQAQSAQNTAPDTTTISAQAPSIARVIINEFLPDPLQGQEEWIELKNESGRDLSLERWELAVGEKRWVFPLGTDVAGSGLLLIPPSLHGLAIPNDGAILELYHPSGKLVFRISFAGLAPQGLSFSHTSEGNWLWAEPSPGKPNAFVPASVAKSTMNARTGSAAPPQEQTAPKSASSLAPLLPASAIEGVGANDRVFRFGTPLLTAFLLSGLALFIRRASHS